MLCPLSQILLHHDMRDSHLGEICGPSGIAELLKKSPRSDAGVEHNLQDTPATYRLFSASDEFRPDPRAAICFFNSYLTDPCRITNKDNHHASRIPGHNVGSPIKGHPVKSPQ